MNWIDDLDEVIWLKLRYSYMGVNGHVDDDRQMVGLLVERVGYRIGDGIVGRGNYGTVQAVSVLSDHTIRTVHIVKSVTTIIYIWGHQDNVETVV